MSMLTPPRSAWAFGGALFFVTWLLWATGGLMYFYSVGTVFFATRKMEREIREVEALGEANPAFAPGLKIEGADQGDEHKRGFVALSYHDVLHENRGVSVQTEVRLADLLEPGESLPEPALLKAFAQARAARLADAECRQLEQTLARRCVVRTSYGQPRDDGFARISMTLGFVQKSPFGPLPAGPRAAYVETNQHVGANRPQPISLFAAAEARARAYTQIAELCDELRAAEGNCAIANASVATTSASFRRAGPAELYVRATLSSLTELPPA